MVSAQASFVKFKESSGAAAVDAALAQLNARLAARGALPSRRTVRLLKLSGLLSRAGRLVR